MSMHPIRVPRSTCLVPALLAGLAGCDGSSGDPAIPPTVPVPPAATTTQSMTATPSLGRIRNATVFVLTLARAPIDGASGELADDGSVTLMLPADLDDPVIVEVRGDDDADYFDESTRTFRPFPAPRRLRTVLSAPRAQVGITPLTEIAATMLDRDPDVTPADIDAANEQVRQRFAPDVADITAPPAVLDADSAAGALTDDDAGRYAALLASLVELGAGTDAPALAVLDQLSEDFADGELDGAVDGVVQDDRTFDVGAPDFGDRLRDAIGRVIMDFGDGTLAADDFAASVGGLGGDDTPPDGGSGGGSGGGAGGGSTPAGSTSPATVNPALVGTYELVYADESPASTRDPFADGATVVATVGANGTLTIGSQTFTDPFFRAFGGTPNQAEVIWLDAANGIEYALSDNVSPSFNEINVGDATAPQPGGSGIPGFLGQLREDVPAVNPATTIAQFAGSYAMRVAISCPAAQALCPNATAAGGMVTVTVGADGTISYGSTVLDPAVEGATFADTRGRSIEPGLQLSVPGAAGRTLAITLHIDSDAVVAALLRQSASCGNNCQQTSSAYAEVPEDRAEVLAYFDDFIAATTPPRMLTIIQDDPGYSGTANFISDTPSRVPGLCRTFALTATRSPTNVSNSRPEFAWGFTTSGFALTYQRSLSRFATDATSARASFNGGQLVLTTDGNVRFEEGLLAPASGFVGTVRDVATSVQADIDAVCGNHSTLAGTVLTPTNPTSFRLTVTNSGGTAVLEVLRQNASGTTSTPFSVNLPDGDTYTVTAELGSGDGACAVTGGTVPLAGNDVTDVMVDCVLP